MAEESNYPSLQGNRISTTYAGLLHFPHSLSETGEKENVYDGVGNATSLKLGGVNNGIEITGGVDISGSTSIGGAITVNGDSTIKKNVSIGGDLDITGKSDIGGALTVGGDVLLTDGAKINDLIIGSANATTTLIAPKNTEVGKLKIRETTSDYELIFGNSGTNLFTIMVKNGGGNNFYIKNNYSDGDNLSPLWINRSTGEVNIKNLNVENIKNIDSNPNRVNRNVSIIPTGMIAPFPSLKNTPPDGWFICDGSVKNKNDYPELFEILDYDYGGSGDYFKLPDYRELFLRGHGGGRNYDAKQGRIPGDYQDDAMQGHWHGSRTQNAGSGTDMALVNGDNTWIAQLNSRTTVQNPIADATHGEPRTDKETRPKNIAVIYCIKW